MVKSIGPRTLSADVSTECKTGRSSLSCLRGRASCDVPLVRGKTGKVRFTSGFGKLRGPRMCTRAGGVKLAVRAGHELQGDMLISVLVCTLLELRILLLFVVGGL